MRLVVRNNRIIREKGELYLAAKAKLGHGHFYKWLEEIGVSPDKAQTYMQIIRDLGEELSNADRGRHLRMEKNLKPF